MPRTGVLRLLELLVVLLLVSMGTYGLLSLVPGDPALAILGPGQDPADYARVEQELGLNQSLPVRYLSWIGHALTGDLGNSIIPPGGAVVDRIGAALPVSLELALLGLGLAVVVAIPVAMLSALRPGGRLDRFLSASTFTVLSIPSFLAGLLLILLFVRGWGIFPRAEWVRLSSDLGGNLQHAVLPTIVVALTPMVVFIRVLRSDLIATLQEDYILAARAKGMPIWHVLLRDALRPSSFSLITLAAVNLGTVVGSTVIVETLFSLPGLGTLIVRGASQGDIPLVQGAVLVVAVVYVLANSFVDLAYGFIDPRVRRVSA